MSFILPLRPGRFALAGAAMLVAGLVASSLVAAWFREDAVQVAEVMAGDEATARGMPAAAAAHYRAAAEALVPSLIGSPSELAMKRLAALAREAAIRGERTTAILAYGALRTAALATQSAWISNAYWRSVAEEGLARLAVSDSDTTSHRDEALAAVRSDLGFDSIPTRGKLTVLWASALLALLGLARLVAAPTGSDLRLARLSASVGFAAYACVSLLS